MRQDVRRKGEMRVDTQRGLVLDQVAVGVRVPVVELGLGRDGDVLVASPEGARAGTSNEAGVREDDWDGEAEDAKGLEEFGGVVVWMVERELAVARLCLV